MKLYIIIAGLLLSTLVYADTDKTSFQLCNNIHNMQYQSSTISLQEYQTMQPIFNYKNWPNNWVNKQIPINACHYHSEDWRGSRRPALSKFSIYLTFNLDNRGHSINAYCNITSTDFAVPGGTVQIVLNPPGSGEQDWVIIPPASKPCCGKYSSSLNENFDCGT